MPDGGTQIAQDDPNRCPLCGEPLKWWGDEPSCSPCVIDGHRAELNAALEARKPA